jgi:hypothetical protein
MEIDNEALDKAKILDPAKPPMKAAPRQEFPKIVYKHPKDKAKDHRFKVVNDPEEHQAALDAGYQNKPHVPVVPEPKDPEFDEDDAPAAEPEVAHKPKKSSKKDAPAAE